MGPSVNTVGLALNEGQSYMSDLDSFSSENPQ
jgi:hypothetical protein